MARRSDRPVPAAADPAPGPGHLRRRPWSRPHRRHQRLSPGGHRPDGRQLRDRRGGRHRPGARPGRHRPRRGRQRRRRLAGQRIARPHRRDRTSDPPRQRVDRPRGRHVPRRVRRRPPARRSGRRRADRRWRGPADRRGHGDREHDAGRRSRRAPGRCRAGASRGPRDRHRRHDVDAQDGGRARCDAPRPTREGRPDRPPGHLRRAGPGRDDGVPAAGGTAAHTGDPRRSHLLRLRPGRAPGGVPGEPVVVRLSPRAPSRLPPPHSTASASSPCWTCGCASARGQGRWSHFRW